MSNSSGVRVRNIIGLLGFLAQQEPGKERQVGELLKSFEKSSLYEGDVTEKGSATRGHEDATRGKLNAILDVHEESAEGQELFPLVLGGLSGTERDRRGKKWVINPVLDEHEMKYLAMLLAGDARTAYAGRKELWKKLTLMNRSFANHELVKSKAKAATSRNAISSPTSEKVFENLRILDDAVRKQRCVTFSLCRYKNDGSLLRPNQGAKEYRANRIAPLGLRCVNGRFVLEGKYSEVETLFYNEGGSKPHATAGNKTYSFLVDMICDLAYWNGEGGTDDGTEALTFSVSSTTSGKEKSEVRLMLYAQRPSEETKGSGHSTPMEKLRNQLFTQFGGRTRVVSDKSAAGILAKEAGWETAVAIIKGVDEYELDNWAPYVRGQMHEALGTVDPPAGNEKSSPSALNMPYAVRQ